MARYLVVSEYLGSGRVDCIREVNSKREAVDLADRCNGTVFGPYRTEKQRQDFAHYLWAGCDARVLKRGWWVVAYFYRGSGRLNYTAVINDQSELCHALRLEGYGDCAVHGPYKTRGAAEKAEADIWEEVE